MHDRPPGLDDDLVVAEEMAAWFYEVFLSGEGEIGEIHPVASSRIDSLCAAATTDKDRIVKAISCIWHLPSDMQNGAAYYFCGFPRDTIELFTGLTTEEIEQALQALLQKQQADLIDTPVEKLRHNLGVEVMSRVHRTPVAKKTTYTPWNGYSSFLTDETLNLFAGRVRDEGNSWQEQGLCAQTDPEAFFPEKGGSTREAKKVCVGCEVRTQCLKYALDNDERYGIWGGLSERERRKLKKQ